MGTGSFQGVEVAGAWGWTLTPSSAKVLERVELDLYSHYGPSWLKKEWNPPIHDKYQTPTRLSIGVPSIGSLLEQRIQIQHAKLSIEPQKWIIQILKLDYKFYKHRFTTLSCYNYVIATLCTN